MANEFTSINSDVIETVIGAKTKFKGSVNTDKPIRIDGVFEGKIESTSFILVSESGLLDADVTCKELDLIGEARGTVTCTENFKFALSGKFTGEAYTTHIDLHPGSYFDGKLKIQR